MTAFEPPFKNQVVIITGAASGFGKLLAERLSAQGARLVLGDIDVTGVQTVVQSLGDACLGYACDVTVEDQIKALSDAAIRHFGRLDIAVNNAGSSTAMKSLLETTEKEFDFNINVNAKSVFFGIKHQVPHMIKQGGGAILNVASMAGINGAPFLTSYSAAKHAVVGITRTAALEFAKYNIRVNAICPYFSPTPLVTKGIAPEYLDRAVQSHPMKRLGGPEEMVEAMMAILTPGNRYMTGQAIAVDGGVTA